MEIQVFQLSNTSGDTVNIVNLGARIHQWHTQVNGQSRQIIVGCTKVEDYRTDDSYLGAIAGPYANRIKNAEVTIDGRQVKLSANEGKNQLHGGKNALASQFWQTESISDSQLVLTTTLADGHNGFPGPVTFKVTYSLLPESELVINIEAQSPQTTIVGPTGHAYFNLSANDNNIKSHLLTLYASAMTPVDNENIPTGEIVSVFNTPFNFLNQRTIASMEEQALDHNYMIDTPFDLPCAKLTSPEQDLTLAVFTNYPAIQVYDGKYLSGELNAHQGICLEPQFPPNAPNQENFPFEFTRADKVFKREIRYQLHKNTIPT